jgi:hypothetical protein
MFSCVSGTYNYPYLDGIRQHTFKIESQNIYSIAAFCICLVNLTMNQPVSEYFRRGLRGHYAHVLEWDWENANMCELLDKSIDRRIGIKSFWSMENILYTIQDHSSPVWKTGLWISQLVNYSQDAIYSSIKKLLFDYFIRLDEFGDTWKRTYISSHKYINRIKSERDWILFIKVHVNKPKEDILLRSILEYFKMEKKTIVFGMELMEDYYVETGIKRWSYFLWIKKDCMQEFEKKLFKLKL